MVNNGIYKKGNLTYYGDFVVTGGEYGTDFTYANETLKIQTGTALTIAGETSRDKIIVDMTASSATANLTLQDLTIDVSAKNYASAFEVWGTANITLVGTNTLKSGKERAGLKVGSDSAITISGDGILNATGGYQGAGIGGGRDGAGGTVTISGGTVTATGGENGAGIGGGGYEGSGGTVTISGGTVTATGIGGAAGIGGGYNGAGGTVTITGGTVTAKGGANGAGIGSGQSGAGGTVTISGGTVTATGGEYGAGIGGGNGGAGGTVTISGGTVTATGGDHGAGIGGGNGGAGGNITITGGTVTAKDIWYGAGIGGGDGGEAGAFSTGENGNAFILASSISDQSGKSGWQGVIFEGTEGAVYGTTVTLTEDATIPEGYTLAIAEGQTLTTAEGVTLSHTHVYNREIVAEQYKTENEYEYYKSCFCGEKSDSETFKESVFFGASISLGSDITVKYHAKDRGFTAPQVKFTINHYTKTVDGVLENGEYVFIFDGVATQWIGDTIRAEFIDNGETVEIWDDYSVLIYLNNLKSRSAEEHGYSEEKYNAMITLINDLLVYGGASQTYKNYRTDALVSAGVTGTTFVPLTTTDRTVSQGKYVTFTNANLYFDSVNHLRFRFRAADVTGLTFTVAKNNGEEQAIEYVADGEKYLIKTEPIKAVGFDDVYTIKAYKDGVLDATLTYSVKSYVAAMQNGGDAVAELAKATYNYGLSAKAFRDAQ